MIHFALSHNVMSHVTPVEGTEYYRYKYVKNILFVYSHKTQLNIKLSLLLYYNITTTCFGLNYRPSSGCI